MCVLHLGHSPVVTVKALFKKKAVICNTVGNDLSSQIGFILYAVIPFHFITAVFDKLKG